MTNMIRKIISDKRVDEVILGFADYADIYFEKDDQKVYDDDDEEQYEDKIITRAQGNYLLEAEHDDLGWSIKEEATREYMIMIQKQK